MKRHVTLVAVSVAVAVAIAAYFVYAQPTGRRARRPTAVAPAPLTTPVQPPPADIDVITNSIGMKLVYIEPGEFDMGSPASERRRENDEAQHRVKLTRGFRLGMYEVTQEQWMSVMGSNPSDARGDDYPVEQVSWDDAVEFCRKLSEKEGRTYRLPTEAEWEYACRAGTTGAYAGTGNLDDMGWYAGNSGGRKQPVGRKQPNAWGLFDMHGNVWEWCLDWYYRYPQDTVVDPRGPESGAYRIRRGGGTTLPPRLCRAANRNWFGQTVRDSYQGLRVVLESPGPGE